MIRGRRATGDWHAEPRKHYYTLPYTTLLYAALLYYTLLYSTLLYSTLLYFTLLYSTLLYFTLLYSTLLYSTLLYSTLLYYRYFKGGQFEPWAYLQRLPSQRRISNPQSFISANLPRGTFNSTTAMAGDRIGLSLSQQSSLNQIPKEETPGLH